jgi:two-component system chemotaxis response regulator CheY
MAAPPRILIVDPDELTRREYQTCFDRGLYDIVEAADGRQALASALTRPPSLILTELQLPLLDGISLCHILSSDRVTAQTPIVVVTSESDPSEHERARRAGASTVLCKPVTSEVVIAEAHRLLGRAADLADRTAAAMARASRRVRASSERIRRAPLAHGVRRYRTTSPPSAPPPMFCPACAAPLKFTESYVGGVNERMLEQWDYYVCEGCATRYRYRQRVLAIDVGP